MLQWCREHSAEAEVVASLERYAEAALVLWQLDLGPALAVVKQGYALRPRGSAPWEPLILLRVLLLAILVGQPSLNQWVADLRASRVLRLLSGVLMDPKGRCPGVGTLYDFMHRLHDGPCRTPCAHQPRPSQQQRRRATAPKVRKRPKALTQGERRARKRRRDKDPLRARCALQPSVTAQLVATLKECQSQPHANDLLGRLGQLLFEVGVQESARRGLLGDPQKLLIAGDGSALPTGANAHGQRTCECKKSQPCECPRRYSDPDADWGYDSYRDAFFFGHHIYEWVACQKGGHDLPLALRLDPASTSDYVASLTSLEQLRKLLRDQNQNPLQLAAAILDAGHDGVEVYRFIAENDITPVIPLRVDAPAQHPRRPALHLSKRGVPLCPAHVEMILAGTNGKGGQIFGCPVKAKVRIVCPQAPDAAVGYSCHPVLKLGHTVVVNAKDDPRLFPPIPRNHPEHQRLMNLRSGSERSFSVKKERFQLLAARHRRASFWLIRLHLMALLQHATAWAANEDARGLLDHLLGRQAQQPAA